MTVERTLDHAHRMLRQGKIAGAIAAYAEVLEERPDDWPAANRLGDLYLQTGQLDQAIEQFTRVAQYLLDRNLLPKAAALYKKVLKMVPRDEQARAQLADIALRQGFLVDALVHLDALARHRREAGDETGAVEVEQRIGHLRQQAASHDVVAARKRAAAPEPVRGQAPAGTAASRDAWIAPREASPGGSWTEPPADVSGGDVRDAERGASEPAARRVEDAEPTAEDRELRLKLMLIEGELKAGRMKRARQLVLTVLSGAPNGTDHIVELAKRRMGDAGDATVMCVEALLEAARRDIDEPANIAAVRAMASWVPQQPEGSQWPVERLQRLAQIDASARLEHMRRESDAILEAFPDLSMGEDLLAGQPGVPPSPSFATAVAAAV